MRRLALLLLVLVPAPLWACDVILSNATTVDVGVVAHGRDVILGPGQAQRIPVTALAVVEFGAIAYAFQAEAATQVLCGHGHAIILEARSDGSLWRQGEAQPDGFPLRPVGRQDLTGLPPNNAFKPKLDRYAVNMAGTACHVASYALQFGLT